MGDHTTNRRGRQGLRTLPIYQVGCSYSLPFPPLFPAPLSPPSAPPTPPPAPPLCEVCGATPRNA